MIWNFLIVGAVVLIALILARRIPAAAKIQNQEKPEVKAKEITRLSLVAQADDAFENSDLSKAEELYIRAAAQDPTNSKVYTRLGEIFMEKKNYYDAKDAYLQATKLEPDIAERYASLGLAYMGLKDYYKACQVFQKSVELDPKNKNFRKFYEKAEKTYNREKKKGKR